MTTTKKAPERAKEHSSSLIDEIRSYSSADIVIKPYINPDEPRENMGLEKYNQVLFEGTMHEQQLRCTIINNVTRYVTGLDEFSDEVKRMRDEKEKEAKIKLIRETVAQLEKELYANSLDVDDPDFWSKTIFAPTKKDYWENVNIVVGNEGKTLDPSNPHDLLLIIAAEAGGFDDIAPSFEHAKTSPSPPKFYVERKKDKRVQDSKVQQLRDDAIFELVKIKKEEPQMLFWYCKNLLPISNQYKKTDPIDIWYSDLSSFVMGVGIERDKKKAPSKFLAMIDKDRERLQIRAYVLEAAFLKKLITKADGKIYNGETNSMLGSNLEEVVEYLRLPINQTDLDSIQNQIDPLWNR